MTKPTRPQSSAVCGPTIRVPIAQFLRSITLASCLFAAGVLTGCSGEKKQLEVIYSAAGANPTQGVAALRQAFFAKQITPSAAIDLAHERIDTLGDAASVAFAQSVLDFIAQCEPDISPKVINDFFWIRCGTLAANASAAAMKRGDIAGARRVVLAGPKSWQTEAYWRRQTAHDALASLVLHQSGESQEALDRLTNRPDLAEEVDAAKKLIEKEMRSKPRPRPKP